MISAHAKIVQDVPPFVTIDLAGCVVGLNLVGLRRNGFTAEQVVQLKAAYRVIYRRGVKWSEVLEQLEARVPRRSGGDVQQISVQRRARLRARAPHAARRHDQTPPAPGRGRSGHRRHAGIQGEGGVNTGYGRSPTVPFCALVMAGLLTVPFGRPKVSRAALETCGRECGTVGDRPQPQR